MLRGKRPLVGGNIGLVMDFIVDADGGRGRNVACERRVGRAHFDEIAAVPLMNLPPRQKNQSAPGLQSWRERAAR